MWVSGGSSQSGLQSGLELSCKQGLRLLTPCLFGTGGPCPAGIGGRVSEGCLDRGEEGRGGCGREEGGGKGGFCSRVGVGLVNCLGTPLRLVGTGALGWVVFLLEGSF